MVADSAGLQKSQHGEHAPMICRSVEEPQLSEDRSDVLLNGPQRHHQMLRNRLIATPGCDELQHLPLAWCQGSKRVAAGRKHATNHVRIEHGAARADLLDSALELIKEVSLSFNK